MPYVRLPKWQLITDKEDFLGPPFRTRTFAFGGVNNTQVCSLVHYAHNSPSETAILYLHGYTDYFFQIGLAKAINALGYPFYALDLQGYGRSIRPNAAPNSCNNLEQYFDDIAIALSNMRLDGIKQVIILAHSTSALIVGRFLQHLSASSTSPSANEGTEHEQPTHTKWPKISGLILNSPFLSLPYPPAQLPWMTAMLKGLTSILPFIKLVSHTDKLYAKSLHQSFHGEWDYRLDLKPSQGFPLSFQWLNAIIEAQQKLQQQPINLPTLLCCSKKSTYNATTLDALSEGDGVLDVDGMQNAAKRIFTHLHINTIKGGFHDLYLSPPQARQDYMDAITLWLSSISQKKHC